MKIPKPIFYLQGRFESDEELKIHSHDVHGLQVLLTAWRRAGGNGFIYRLKK